MFLKLGNYYINGRNLNKIKKCFFIFFIYISRFYYMGCETRIPVFGVCEQQLHKRTTMVFAQLPLCMPFELLLRCRRPYCLAMVPPWQPHCPLIRALSHGARFEHAQVCTIVQCSMQSHSIYWRCHCEDFVFGDSADPYQKTHSAAFHLDLHCLQKNPFRDCGL